MWYYELTKAYKKQNLDKQWWKFLQTGERFNEKPFQNTELTEKEAPENIFTAKSIQL